MKSYQRTKMYRHTCTICGVFFITTRNDKHLCSPRCRQAKSRRERAAARSCPAPKKFGRKGK